MAQVLRPELYDRLEERFGDVRVSNPGQPLVEEYVTEWVDRRGRAVPQLKSRTVCRGETYRVSCPFCGDERLRLSISHAWGLRDPRTGGDRLWLAKCFNETNCLGDRGRRHELRFLVFGPAPLPTGPAVSGPEGGTARRTPVTGPPLPEWLAPLHVLPAGDPARAYLLGRGFDPDVLGRELGVSFCTWAPHPFGEARDRIIVPVTFGEQGAGFQGRRIDGPGQIELDAPKWWTAPGTPKSHILYNFDVARTYSVAVVCEGITDVWRVGPCGVALFGLDLSAEQERLITETWAGGTVVMLLDNDGGDNPAAQRRNGLYSDRLRRRVGNRVVEVALPAGTDPADLGSATLWSLIRSAAERQGVALPLDELVDVIPCLGPGRSLDPVGSNVRPDEVAERLLEQVTGTAAGGPNSVEERLATAGLGRLFRDVEYPAAVVAAAMRARGVGVDVSLLEELEFELGVRLGLRREEIAVAAGRRINPRSPAQVEDATRLPHSSAATPLSGPDSRVTDLVRRFRELSHAASVAANLMSRVDRRTERVHCALDSLGTDTGRFTCSDPPLHSLPVAMRDLVIAPPGHALVEADFSQIELRVLAHVSRDQLLLDAFETGIDLHRRTAALALGVPEAGITDEDRKVGKAVNFGIVYGQTPHGLARKLGTSVPDARALLDAYFDAHSGVRDWIERTRNEALRDGYVTTLYGRRRLLPGLHSPEPAERDRALRQAVNTVIQGSAAEINKLALARLHRELDGRCRLVLTVHDSILVEAPRDLLGGVAKQTADLMRIAPPGFSVPLDVKVGTGATWGECQRAARRP